MHGVCARLFRRLDDSIDAQVTLAGRRRTDRQRLIREDDMKSGTIGIRVHGDRGVAHLAARADDAHRDLPAIRDQHFHEGAL
jgi:hypothetical protein